MSVATLEPPGSGSVAGRPWRSAQLSNSGSQYASFSDGSHTARASASRKWAGAGFARRSTIRPATAERARRASSRPIRKATGPSPRTKKVARRIVSNAGPSNAPMTNRTATITRPRAKESNSSATERRRGRPASRRRAASTPMPATQQALMVTSWTWSRTAAGCGAATTSSRL